MAAQLREPRRPVRRHGERGQARFRRGDRELFELSAGKTADLVRGDLRESRRLRPGRPRRLPGRSCESARRMPSLHRREKSATACPRSGASPIPFRRTPRRRRTARHRPEPSRTSAATTWRVKRPSCRRVTLPTVGSANHTAPSGAIVSRPSLATGVDSPKEAMLPSGETREILCFGASVYHAPPSASTARPSGSMLSAPLGILLDLPVSDPSDGVGRLEREPDRPVARRRDRNGHVRAARQFDLFEPARDPTDRLAT